MGVVIQNLSILCVWKVLSITRSYTRKGKIKQAAAGALELTAGCDWQESS